MNAYEIVSQLWRYGHFFSPAALNVTLVFEEDLPSLRLSDDVVREAARSYQEWFKDELDQLTLRAGDFGGHRRESIADGDIGPSTIDLLRMPRCGQSDYMRPGQALEANWPEQCRMDITTSYRMNLSGLSAGQVQDLWVEADGWWEQALKVKLPLRLSNYPNTRVFAFAASLPGSVLADQVLAYNDCSARLRGRFDTRQWSDRLFVTTVTHEHGHALGLGHLRDNQATMYPSITQASMSRRGRPNNSDVQAMLGLGYERNTDPPDPPDPPDPDDPQGPGVRTMMQVEFKGRVTEAKVVSLR